MKPDQFDTTLQREAVLGPPSDDRPVYGRCEPAASLVTKLGGPSAVAAAIRRHTVGPDQRARQVSPSTVLRWTMPITAKDGRGGHIPLKYWSAIIRAGREIGITITIADLNTHVAQALKEAANAP